MNMMSCNCDRCGKELPISQAVVEPKGTDGLLILCKECTSLFGHCHTCLNLGKCAFFDDPDPMPQFVIARQEHRTPMGVQIIQRQVPNPERAKKFCQDAGCKCLHTFEDDTKLCCRHSPYTTCTNYTEQEYKKFVEDFPVETMSKN